MRRVRIGVCIGLVDLACWKRRSAPLGWLCWSAPTAERPIEVMSGGRLGIALQLSFTSRGTESSTLVSFELVVTFALGIPVVTEPVFSH